MPPCSRIAAVLLVTALVAPALHAQSFQGLGFLEPTNPNRYSYAEDVSADGSVVVGYSFAATGPGTTIGGAYRWEGSMQSLPYLPTPYPYGHYARGVSADGNVTVGLHHPVRPDQVRVGVRWVGTSPQELVPGHIYLDASAASADGSVIVGNITSQAFRWANGSLTPLEFSGTGDTRAHDVSADGEVVVGRHQGGDGCGAYRWEGGSFETLPALPEEPGGNCEAYGVSADASVIVGHAYDGARYRAVRWVDGAVEALGSEGGASWNWRAVSTSADGRVTVGYVDYYVNNANVRRAVRWTEEGGAQDLRTFLADSLGLDLTGWTLTIANAVSDDGHTIVGNGVNPNGNEEGWRATIRDAPLVVNSTADRPNESPDSDACDTGETVVVGGQPRPECTLRAAIEAANAGAASAPIEFEIEGSGPHTITLGSPLPPVTEPLVIDATTQPGYAGTPRVTLTGAAEFGLVLAGGESTVRGLAVGGFSGAGIALVGPGGNAVEACHIGVDAAGTAALANGNGVLVNNSPDNRIGGTTAAQRNVISGNADAGVEIVGAATGNRVVGNYIGTDAVGTAALPNAVGVGVGAPGVRVGGPTVAERNVISGNTAAGIIVAADGDGATIQSNFIGLSTDGTAALGNGTDPETGVGLLVLSAADVTVGGPTATPGQPPGNVVAASAGHAVRATGRLDGDGPADNFQVLGNLVGTDAGGATALPNGGNGVFLSGAVRNARVGQAGGGNVVVVQDSSGVVLEDLGAAGGAPDGAHVAANTIGLDAAGSALLGRVAVGVETRVPGGVERGIENVRIGGDAAGEGNRIRAGTGVVVQGRRSTGAVVASNTVGLLASGAIAEPDSAVFGIAVLLADGTEITGNTVGGQVVGILLASNQNTVTDNRVGTDQAGNAARPNTLGVWIPRSLVGAGGTRVDVGDGHTVGARGQGNVISGNRLAGVLIGNELDLGAVGDGRSAMRDAVVAFTGRIGPGARPRPAAPAVARGGGGTPDGNVVAFNRIGTNADGTAEIGNGRAETIPEAAAGVDVESGVGTVVLGNLISGNGAGVVIQAESDAFAPDGTRVEGNVIGGSMTPGATIPNLFGGIEVQDATHTAVGAAPLEPGGPAVGNRIVGNAGGDLGHGVRKLTAEFTTVRQTTFEGNTGESIERLAYEDGSADPEYPDVFVAAAGADAVAFRFTPVATGPVDVFVSPDCTGGIADGAYALSVDGTAGTALDLPLSPGALGVPSAAAAVGLYVAATNTTTGPSAATSEFSECLRIAAAGDVAQAPVAEGETGPVLDDVDMTVDVTDNPDAAPAPTDARRAAGTLYAARYALVPQPGPFAGSATSPDGTAVAPNAVSSSRYWTLRADGLGGITYTACLGLAGIGGVAVPGQLVVVQRAAAGRAWTPRASTLADGETRLCASGLTAFGELAIGADSLVNPVPSEPGPEEAPESAVPTALSVSAWPNPARGAATVAVAVPVAGTVWVEVYDALGRRVSVLVAGELLAGTHALRLETASLPSGVYVVRATGSGAVVAQRLTVVR